MIPGFLILDIKIQEIFQSMKIIGTEYHKIAMTQNIVITKGKQKTISECQITFCVVSLHKMIFYGCIHLFYLNNRFPERQKDRFRDPNYDPRYDTTDPKAPGVLGGWLPELQGMFNSCLFYSYGLIHF